MSRPGYLRASSTNLSQGQAPRSLEGKLAIVTGSSRGIGAAIAQNLASKGAHLILNYTSDSSASKATALAEELEAEYGVSAITVQADLGTTTGPEFVITTAKNHFSHPKTGKFQIDIIINNAGISENAPIEKVTLDVFERTYAVNVRGPLLLIKAAEPYLPHDRSGRIVNLSSVSASLGPQGQSVYAGSKAAVEGMTRVWARELAERATVNAINPGPVMTDMWVGTTPTFHKAITPMVQMTPLSAVRPEIDPPETLEISEKLGGGRPAYDYEIAGLVGMLVSEEAGWSTGSVVCANGGARFSV